MCMLKKAIYGLKQSPQVWLKKFSRVVTDGGFHICVVDYSVFYRKTSGGCVVLAVYVNDILLTGSDAAAISDTKEYLSRHFVTNDMDKPKYFLSIEFACSRERMYLKYTLDLLQETGLLGCKLESTSIEPSRSFSDSSSKLLEDPGQYRCLIGKLIYLTVTRPDIAYVISLLIQFMHEPKIVY